MSKPGAQEYYDSLFKLYASWGVDYVKVDDISRPYDATQQAEIEAIRRAIDKTGRPIVLSLSPGATPLSAGPHVQNHANLWRISDDFWDRWELLQPMFERLDHWTPFRREGNWPDADMLPLGIIEFTRPTNFTPDEGQTLMTLWSIARSPLIFGGDMTRLDEPTLKLLTNAEVIKVNQHSVNNRQMSREDDLIVWAAEVPNSDHQYVALFNAQSNDDKRQAKGTKSVGVDFRQLGITGEARVRDLWSGEDLGEFDGRFERELPFHGSGLYRVEPALSP
jgi:alpha-galactosidase